MTTRGQTLIKYSIIISCYWQFIHYTIESMILLITISHYLMYYTNDVMPLLASTIQTLKGI